MKYLLPLIIVISVAVAGDRISGTDLASLKVKQRWSGYYEAVNTTEQHRCVCEWNRADFEVLAVPDQGDEYVLQITTSRPDDKESGRYTVLKQDNNPFKLVLTKAGRFEAVEFMRDGRWTRFDAMHPQWVEALFQRSLDGDRWAYLFHGRMAGTPGIERVVNSGPKKPPPTEQQKAEHEDGEGR